MNGPFHRKDPKNILDAEKDREDPFQNRKGFVKSKVQRTNTFKHHHENACQNENDQGYVKGFSFCGVGFENDLV